MEITQIVFPKKIKEVKKIHYYENKTRVTDKSLFQLFETVFCFRRNNWISIVTCLSCSNSERTLEEILEDGVGC